MYRRKKEGIRDIFVAIVLIDLLAIMKPQAQNHLAVNFAMNVCLNILLAIATNLENELQNQKRFNDPLFYTNLQRNNFYTLPK